MVPLTPGSTVSVARILAVSALAALALATTELHAQVAPHAKWQTVSTRHFDVHFTPELEEIGRAAAVVAESAYVRLATELVEPRTRVHLVVSDNVDYSNGLASPFPTNSIIIYALPPVDGAALRFYEDWISLVVTHELAHIFHLDRARGVWRLLQYAFGRNPALMPNLYQPAWVKEGLAVYYETRLTNAGRLAGSEFAMYARAAASADRLPSLGELSSATPTFLGGEIAYAYGAMAFEYLARTRGEEGVGRYVEASSRQLIPYRLNLPVRRGFGTSMNAAWDEWRDSVRGATTATLDPLPGWEPLTSRGWYVSSPRWLRDGRLVYVANTGREVTALYSMDASGRTRRLTRRNSLEPSVQMPDGSLLFAQAEFVDPFTIRSDLWRERNGRQRRLTHGARLSHPDVRADGRIVAVQGVPGSTRLVLLQPDGSGIQPITAATADTQWTEPRWSPDGRQVAAVRWVVGGVTEIVVLDERGRDVHVLARDRAVNSMPAWSADGRNVFYASDRSGSMQLWSATLPVAPGQPAANRILSSATTGVRSPEPAPDGERIAAVSFRSDGWHLGMGQLPAGATAGAAPALTRSPVVAAADARVGSLVSAGRDDTPSRSYNPWPQLLPRYWAPSVSEGPAGNVSVGALTSGRDVVGRHMWTALLTVEPSSNLWEGAAAWRYAGLGQPFIDLGASQRYSRDRIILNDEVLGDLDERVRYASMGGTIVRPRARSGASLSLVADVESRLYLPRTQTLGDMLVPELHEVRTTPGVGLAASWTNTQLPSLAISPENGIAASASLRNRWLPDILGGGTTRSAVVSLSAFRALPLPGPSHHVLAVRGAVGVQDAGTTSPFEIGGVSGGSIELLPGLPVGGARRTFFVRGWSPASFEGTRAASGSVEWRAPIAVVGRGVPHLPAFVQRLSFTGFFDAAAAWCAPGDMSRTACAWSSDTRQWLTGAGGELVLDLAPLYDVPYRFRLGAAFPVSGNVSGARAEGVYFTLGSSF